MPSLKYKEHEHKIKNPISKDRRKRSDFSKTKFIRFVKINNENGKKDK